uniref:Dipeptidyl-peptidase 4 n=1 Tax=Labrus bergylta TaxID=56723 RepID=A0A3Q3EZL2_9LABR
VSIAKVLLGVFGLTVVVVLIAVPTAVFLNEEKANTNQKSFTLEDVFNSTLKPKSYSMRWISGGRQFVIRYLISKKDYDMVFLSLSNQLWRHSFTASYSLYDRETSTFLTTSDIPDEVQYFAWAPEGNKLAYVWRNNVYVKTSPGSPPQQVTFNGEENLIFNGHPDWVYEEEMFSSNQGLWWSPGGKYVAYIESNDREVHTIKYTWYGENQYPTTVSIPYPKPGTPNPIVKLFVVDTDNTTDISEVIVPALFSSSDHYLATVNWVSDERIAVQWLKRVQNHLILQIYNFSVSSWVPLEVKHDFSPPEPVFAADRNSYYLLMSDKNGYKHIHHVNNVGKNVSLSESPRGRNVYKKNSKETKCLTCAVRDGECQYNSAYFSHNASFYRMSCSGQLYFLSVFLFFSFIEILVLEDNTDFTSQILEIQMPTMRRDSIKLGGKNLWYQMYLPPGFDKSKKYPLLIDVYAGPCSQKTDFAYRVGWSTYLASTEKIIVASFDGRGSGYQGDELMHAIYKRLGTYEVEDQITAAREFIKMGFIDKDRVAIWGWSYGGYVTSMALGAGSGVFKCGMAVAPVSKWKYYDSIYTERYMLEPSQNSHYYDNSTVTERAKHFHSVQYLLVHGTADDNVHFQQAAEISEALVDEQVDFEAMWYTDKDHGLGGSAYQHVYTHMSHFLLRCFE